MNIHHMVSKKAEKMGIALEVAKYDDENVIKASYDDKELFHKEARVALDAAVLSRTLDAEFPACSLEVENWRFVVTCSNVVVWDDKELPTLAEVLDKCEDMGLDPEEGYEEPKIRQVVAQRYKEEYAARGDASGCGDWMDKFLKMQTKTKAGTDIERLTAIFEVNGVNLEAKWAQARFTGSRGWQGRYRMSGRQQMDMIAARVGSVKLPEGEVVKCPVEYLEAMLDKYSSIEAEWRD